MADPEKFAQLLTAAIYKIKCRERKKIRVVQDELGYALGYEGESSVEHWRKGHLPPFRVREKLARELVKRNSLGREALEQLLRNADYPYPAILCDDLFPPVHSFQEDWDELPEASFFYGRQEELAELEEWIVSDCCRLVAILGLAGIGKTALSVILVEQIKNQFDYLFRRNLNNAPLIEDILGDCLKFLSNRKRADLPECLEGRLSLLIQHLQKQRCLLVLENVESILQGHKCAGCYRDGYEGYGELLKQVGEACHQSCLILTSREKTREIALLEGKRLPVRSLQLRGLKKIDGQKILKAKGLSGSADEYTALIERYQGHPLALRIVPTTIQDLFHGDISEFLEQETTIFGDIRDMLDEQFDRLSDLEQDIVYWLGIRGGAVSLQDLQHNIMRPMSPGELLAALESLRRRSLIEPNAARFKLQPVVMAYISEQLIEQLS